MATLPARGGISDSQIDEYEQRQESRDLAAKVAALIQACGVPRRYQQATIHGLDQQHLPPDVAGPYRRAAEVAERLGRVGGILALVGAPGTGKTWIAAGLVLDFCRAGRSARYLHAFDYLQGLRQTYDGRGGLSEGRFESNHLRPDLLVIDEVEERGATDWEDRMLRRLIVKRHDDRLATLILSNVRIEQFTERIGGKVMSRMQEDGGEIHQCIWRNLREPIKGN